MSYLLKSHVPKSLSFQYFHCCNLVLKPKNITLQSSTLTLPFPIFPIKQQTYTIKSKKRHFEIFTRVSSSITTDSNMSHAAKSNGVKITNSEKLAKLRELMKATSIHAYVVPTSDPHLLEYVPDCFKRRDYISEFTGSAGTAVITLKEAALWTDGRYFLQAENELTSDWILMKAGTKDCPRVPEWLGKVLVEGDNVGLDPFCHSQSEVEDLKNKLKEKNINIEFVEKNLIDIIWENQRPDFPSALVRIHPEKFAGESVDSKLKRIREKFDEMKAEAVFISSLDELAWILNLRGGDEPYSPIFISYLLIKKDDAIFYIDKNKVPQEVVDYLKSFNIAIDDYGNAIKGVKEVVGSGKNIWFDPNNVTAAIFNAVTDVKESAEDKSKIGKVVSKKTPIQGYKAIKNEKELNGMRDAHLRDAVAIIEFLAWFEKQIATGRNLTEVEVDKELTARRAAQEGFKTLSFPTICGCNANGAIIHYSASPEKCATIDNNSLVLIDSGGQYESGTTDVTRTFHTGKPTEHQILCFTKVLQGHIQLAMAKFPEGTVGLSMDTLARAPLWSLGLDFLHGTGHGVGAHLCVHEGPIGISSYHSRMKEQTPLSPGNIVSNEPGYYEDGSFGIRIENLVIVNEVMTPHNFAKKKYLGFENITFVPIQAKMINTDLLTKAEINYINDYHKEVYEKLAPKVDGETLEWLKNNTAEIKV